MSDASAAKPRSRLPLLLVAAVATAPLIAAYVLYFFWRPSALMNHGELLQQVSVAEAVAAQPDGTPLPLSRFKGKWLMLTVDSGACDTYCQGKLYRMRQVRLTQGENMDRIERAWLLDDDVTPAAQLIADYSGMQLIRAKNNPLLKQLPANGTPRSHIYIVDPLGNVILRYAGDGDATGMKKDFTRLLKASRIG